MDWIGAFDYPPRVRRPRYPALEREPLNRIAVSSFGPQDGQARKP